MKIEDFRFLVDCKKNYEFKFRGLVYNLTYGKDSDGEYIAFGRLYEQKKFYSWGDFMNEARIDNSFFREIIPIL
ncbi:MAG: hypothetical protein IJL70_08965 [Treponema sp.]|nr:hypothetical protein [Treponema sp.]